jgi:hypothetical protein
MASTEGQRNLPKPQKLPFVRIVLQAIWMDLGEHGAQVKAVVPQPEMKFQPLSSQFNLFAYDSGSRTRRYRHGVRILFILEYTGDEVLVLNQPGAEWDVLFHLPGSERPLALPWSVPFFPEISYGGGLSWLLDLQ